MRIGILFLSIFLWQCTHYADSPSTMLSNANMTKALIEVHTLESKILEQNYSLLDSAQTAYQDAEKALFKKLKINYKQYKNTYDYYLKNEPQTLFDIYKVVLDSLRKREKKAPTRENVMAKVPQGQKTPDLSNALKDTSRVRGFLRGRKRLNQKDLQPQ